MPDNIPIPSASPAVSASPTTTNHQPTLMPAALSAGASSPPKVVTLPDLSFPDRCRCLAPPSSFGFRQRRKAWTDGLQAAGLLHDPAVTEEYIAEAITYLQLTAQDPARREHSRTEARSEMARRWQALNAKPVKSLTRGAGSSAR